MARLKHLAPLCLLLSMSAKAADIFPQVPVDKKAHLVVSYAATYTVSDLLKRQGVKYPELWAGLVVGTVGASKELWYDERGDRNDMTANLLGIGLAVGIHYSIRW